MKFYANQTIFPVPRMAEESCIFKYLHLHLQLQYKTTNTFFFYYLMKNFPTLNQEK